MRRILASILIVCLGSLSALAQTLPIRISSTEPQIAYRLFSTWADNYATDARKGKAIGSAVLFGAGSLCVAGSIVTWTKGEEIYRQANEAPMPTELRQNLALGLGIGAGALYLSGILVSVSPIKDYRAIYADVFEERDAEVQEAMAAAVLRYQSDRGKERRITSFVSGILVPVIACGITAGINASQGKTWSDGLESTLQGSSWGMAGSLTSLFTKTPEERLYERYLATRDALYASKK